jgi:MFS family permease
MQNVYFIYAVLFLIGTGRAFSGPASSALLPHLVPKEHFVNAVAWGATIFQIANITGPALGGRLAPNHPFQLMIFNALRDRLRPDLARRHVSAARFAPLQARQHVE